MLPGSDQLLEDVYDLITRHRDEPTRTELARCAKIAVEYRLNKIKQQRLQRAAERRADERRQLRGSGG